MKNKDSAPCRWWGHAIDPTASYYYGVDYCVRCNDSVDGCTGVREWIWVRWCLARDWLNRKVHRLRDWITCSDCQHHWGRHDDTIDHLPF